MAPETKACQSCKSEFVIEPEDFEFYERIKVPPPTWCPECRMKRRMAFMNQRAFYKHPCDLCGKEDVAIFSKKSPQKVYCGTCWWSDDWDAMSYGKEYDFSKPFFQQFQELIEQVPHEARQGLTTSLVNSQYCNICSYLKNCYLILNSDYDEDCAYGTFVERSKRCFDNYMIDLCELCYRSSNLFKCSKVFFSQQCLECIEVSYSKNCTACSYCVGCVNLRNKKYHIFNQPYSKEEYFEKVKELRLGTYEGAMNVKKEVEALARRLPKKYYEGVNNADVTGDYVYNSKRTFASYEAGGAEDCKYSHFLIIEPTRDSYDFTMWGGGAERMYECMGAGGGQNDIKFCFECWTNAQSLQYCWHIRASGSNLFGCLGVKGKQYCILNKQYTKEEYEALLPKVIEHMNTMPYVDALGRTYKYGEFFPPELSPFKYNETVAQEYVPLMKEEAIRQGYGWKDPEARNYAITLPHAQVPNDIADVQDNVLQEVIGCAHEGTCNEQCSTAFKIIPMELEFYKQMGIPLPRLCPNCRHYELLKQRNSLKLYDGQCKCVEKAHIHGAERCPTTFETSYAPDRTELVYCEPCYNAEVA